MSKLKLTREQKRNLAAEKVCRELRFQMAKYGGIGEPDVIFKQFNTWMKLAKVNKYERPK